MRHAYVSDANVVGAFALVLGDRVRMAVEEGCGLRGGPAVALVALHEFAAGDSIAQLARVLGVSHSRTVRVVDQLEAGRWARRRVDTEDARAVSIALTARGERAAERALEARAVVIAELLAPLVADEVRALGDLAGAALGGQATSRDAARRICRLCDAMACGHTSGRCPVTQARLSRPAASP